ncbi:MAG: TatD family hydrolase [Bacteroidales bacterium]|jgi:TatD DNase family protein
MKFIDSHTHLYLEHFNEDRSETIQRAISQGVSTMLLPAIEMGTFDAMMELVNAFPKNCRPMMGLHPTSVNELVEKELLFVESELSSGNYIAVGEIGIDLYWDRTFAEQQKNAFAHQLQLAKKYKLPVVIHTRDSFEEVYAVLLQEADEALKGVFHCFSGSETEARQIIEMGFYLGIGGVVTFKNSGLGKVVANLPLEKMILETDSPYLTPVPFRGKRNESSYIPLIAEKIALLQNKSLSEVAEVTTQNCVRLFNLT